MNRQLPRRVTRHVMDYKLELALVICTACLIWWSLYWMTAG